MWTRPSCILRLVGHLWGKTYGVAVVICLFSKPLSWMLVAVPSTFLTHWVAILDAQMRRHSLVQMVLEVGLIWAVFGASQIVFDSLGEVSARFL